MREEHICYQGILTRTCHKKLWSDTCDAQSSHDGGGKPQPHTHTRNHTTNQAQTQKIQLLKNYKTSMLTAIKAQKSGNGTEKIKQMNLV